MTIMNVIFRRKSGKKPPAVTGCRRFLISLRLFLGDAEDGAFDEGDVDVAGRGIDIDTVDLADAQRQTPQD